MLYVKRLLICSFLFISLFTQAQVLRVTPLNATSVSLANVYDSIIVDSGAVLSLTKNVQVNQAVLIKSYGAIDFDTFSFSGTGNLQALMRSGIKFKKASLTDHVTLSGTTVYGANMKITLDGSIPQNMNAPGFPTPIGTLTINNPSGVTKSSTGDVFITDTLKILSGRLITGGKGLQPNKSSDTVVFICNSTELQDFQLRPSVQNVKLKIQGNTEMFINRMDNKQKFLSIYLYTNLKINGGTFQKGSSILLNGRNLIFTSASTAWLGANSEPSYIDFSKGGSVIRYVNSPNSLEINYKIGNSVHSAKVVLSGGIYKTDTSRIVYRIYPDTNTFNLSGKTDYLNATLIIEKLDIAGGKFDLYAGYDDSKVVGNENSLIVHKFEPASNQWLSLNQDGFVNTATDKFVAFDQDTTTIFSLTNGIQANLPNLEVTSTLSVIDTLINYDTLWVKQNGVLNMASNITSKKLKVVVDSGATFDFAKNNITSLLFKLMPGGTIKTANANGINTAQATSGSIRTNFVEIARRNASIIYNDTVSQNIGTFFSDLGGVVIDNKVGVVIQSNSSVSTQFEIRNGRINNSSNINFNLSSNTNGCTLINNSNPTAFGRLSLRSSTGGNIRYATLMGSQSFDLTASGNLSFDSPAYLTLLSDIKVSSLVFNHQGRFILPDTAKLTHTAKGTLTNGTRRQYRIVLGPDAMFEQLLDTSWNNRTQTFAEIHALANPIVDANRQAITLSFNNANITDTTASASFGFKPYATAPEPDTANGLLMGFKFMPKRLGTDSVRVTFTYLTSQVKGTIGLLKPGSYNGTTWDTVGFTHDATARTITYAGPAKSFEVTLYNPNPVTGLRLATDSKLNVYPNPANNQVIVEGVDAGTVIRIFDLSGREVHNQVLSANGVIGLQTLQKGVYLLQAPNATPTKLMVE